MGAPRAPSPYQANGDGTLAMTAFTDGVVAATSSAYSPPFRRAHHGDVRRIDVVAPGQRRHGGHADFHWNVDQRAGCTSNPEIRDRRCHEATPRELQRQSPRVAVPAITAEENDRRAPPRPPGTHRVPTKGWSIGAHGDDPIAGAGVGARADSAKAACGNCSVACVAQAERASRIWHRANLRSMRQADFISGNGGARGGHTNDRASATSTFPQWF